MSEDSKSYLAAALLILALILCAGISLLTRQINRLEDEPPPTLAISETPSITPMPPTATPSLTPSATSVVTVATLTSAGTGTAVTPPPDTAVPTATPTSTPTGTPTPTPIPLYVVQPGDCLACLSWRWYGTEMRWGDIWEANGRFPRPHLIYPGQELKRPK